MPRPVIGITMDLDGEQRAFIRPGYAAMVERAGGLPVFLAHVPALLPEYLERCDGFILTGGDDPIMEDWGVPTHPRATKVHPQRQEFERALLRELRERPIVPALGICLGMQMMALEAGGAIDQHLPETDAAAAERHWGRKPHLVRGEVGEGAVLSHHRQAIIDPGSLRVCARADDGIIEAVRDPRCAFYLGVQWHPERTEDATLGPGIFQRLIDAARGERSS